MQALTQSYMTGEGSGQLLYETIGHCFDRVARQYPDNAALVACHQDIRWTYNELKTQVDKFATGLIALGIEPGDRVGIWGPNSYEWVLTQFATAKIGAIMVCINPAYRPFELEYVLNKVECKAIVAAEKFKSSEYLAMLNSLAPELADCEPGRLQAVKLPHLTTVIRMGEQQSPGMFNFDDVSNMGGDSQRQRLIELQNELRPDDAINIQFTSGTTGSPKGATLTHVNILNNASNTAQGMRFTADDSLCIPVPLYHCFGMVLGALACVSSGANFRGGENIYPREVEEFLYTHPKIGEVQVFGVEDERMGEEVCAWIRLKDGETMTEDDVRSFCRGQIAYFKVPRYVRFVTEYPMTVTGKIRKVEMREMMAKNVTRDAF